MEYRGYRATIVFDDGLDVFQGAAIGTHSVLSFEGALVKDLRGAFAGTVDEYLAFCAEDGVDPDKPFSGRLQLRLPAELHRAATEAAGAAGLGLNSWLTEAVAQVARAVTPPRA